MEEGNFTIRLESGMIATHSIKVIGTLHWRKELEKEEIENYVQKKIKEINDILQPEIELLDIKMYKKTRVEIWILIVAVNQISTLDKWCRQWWRSHIEKDIADLSRLEIKAISRLARLYL